MPSPESMLHVVVGGNGAVGRAYWGVARTHGNPGTIPNAVITRSGEVYDRPSDDNPIKLGDYDQLLDGGLGRIGSFVIATPSVIGGEIEGQYILDFLATKAPGATAAKGISNGELFRLVKQATMLGEAPSNSFDYSTAVGGNVTVLENLRQLTRDGLWNGYSDISVNPNGTLAFTETKMAQGSTIDKAVAEAQRMGYAEKPKPGEELTAAEILGQEINDSGFKASIMANTMGLKINGNYVDFSDVTPNVSPEDIISALMDGGYRNLVVFSSKDSPTLEWLDDEGPSRQRILGKKIVRFDDGTVLTMGLVRVDSEDAPEHIKAFRDLPSGPTNQMVVQDDGENAGIRWITGRGAGPRETGLSLVRGIRRAHLRLPLESGASAWTRDRSAV